MKTRTITLLLQISSGEIPALVVPSAMYELMKAGLITSTNDQNEKAHWYTTEKGETLVDNIKELISKFI